MFKLAPLGNNNKVILVSNRGSYIFREENSGRKREKAVSGLVSALEPVVQNFGGTWLAWGGRVAEGSKVKGEMIGVPANEPLYWFQEILLTEKEIEKYYLGFSNSCLWPLCHCFLEKVVVRKDYWDSYRNVNQKYAQVIGGFMRSGDLIWVHDFHLALVPEMVRRAHGKANIAFFWHVPFPPPEIFSTLPWAADILRGLLGADCIAFHSADYRNNFLRCVEKILHLPVNWELGMVKGDNRNITVSFAPIGIDWNKFREMASRAEILAQASEIRGRVEADFIFLGVDRLDYTKGILERLLAFETFLEKFPQYRGRVALLQVAVPSRSGVKAYENLKHRVEEAVGRINGRYSINWRGPVLYRYGALSSSELVAHYLAADIALVTPLRDGLNLVAKEFIAAKTDRRGVLVLSAYAGAAQQLREALLVNPYYPEEMADVFRQAVEMPVSEQVYRMELLRKVVQQQDVYWWSHQVLKTLPSKWGKLAATSGLGRAVNMGKAVTAGSSSLEDGV
ncbi:alpha,alpha-trehalose-phosphate synthase (UDP-forming) [Calderihabitans maritimus]|uniref:Trehalose-6-phosphate synthase n=1 Tax=Calderihabitans maritimus TaxID=1246530 RepID=A0A1Z5HRM1_9FIRM|nr:trehalose-6-phosphate synthase [Calderihabitans maritimus]GAW92088.1 trehalose-6-phosphate synthase [Calderihabitans maritimus]